MKDTENLLKLVNQVKGFRRIPESQQELDSTVVYPSLDASKFTEFDSQKKQFIERSLPITNYFREDFTTANFDLTAEQDVNDLLSLAERVRNIMVSLRDKSTNRKKIFLQVGKIEENSEVTVLVGENEDGTPVFEKQVVSNMPVFIEKEVNMEFFDLRAAYDHFINLAGIRAMVSKGRDFGAAKLLREQILSTKQSQYAFNKIAEMEVKNKKFGFKPVDQMFDDPGKGR